MPTSVFWVQNAWGCKGNAIKINGTVSRDVRLTFFCLKHSLWTPYEKTKIVSRTFSFSMKLFDYVQSSKFACPLSQRSFVLALGNSQFSNVKTVTPGYVNTPTYLNSVRCLQNICQCPRSHCRGLRGHTFFVKIFAKTKNSAKPF